MEPVCPVCHVIVRSTDFFCYNCGRNLHPKPLPTDGLTQWLYYAGSLFVPPIGLWWGLKYLRQVDAESKRIGVICIALTCLSIFIVTVLSVRLFQNINTQVNQQLQGLEGF